MADVRQVLADVQAFKTEMVNRFNNIDEVVETLREQVEAGQIDQATLDQIAAEVQSGRAYVEGVNPEDPSGDDVAAP